MKIMRVCLVVLGIAWLTSTAAQTEETRGVFRAATLESALKQAGIDGRLVLIDFYTTWCGPCKMLDHTTWQDPRVIDLLRTKTVAIKLDAEKEADLAKRYKIDAYPTVLFVKPDGTEFDRLVGYRDPAKFIEEFTSLLAGKSSLARAREAALAGKNPIQSRYELGQALSRAGKSEEALREFLWCFDDGMKQSPEYTGVRVSDLLNEIRRLSRSYPPALDALRERRDKARATFLAAENDSGAFSDFAYLNRALGEEELTLEIYDKLVPQDARRKQIGNLVFDQLLETRRYADALKAQPFRQFVEYIDKMRAMFESAKSNMPADIVNAENLYLIQSGAGEIEALAGASQLDGARALIAKLLAIDASAETRNLLREHLQRAGHVELAPAPQTPTSHPPAADAPVAPPSGAAGQ